MPERWADSSTLAFTALPSDGDAIPTMSEVQSTAEALELKFKANPSGDVRKLLSDEYQLATTFEPDFAELVSEGPFSSGLGKGWHQILEVELEGIKYIQLIVAFPLGEAALVGVGVASAARFPRCEGELRAIFESLGPAPRGPAG